MVIKTEKIIVKGINIRKKSVKPRRQGEQGGIIPSEFSIHSSKVALVCPKCGKPLQETDRAFGCSGWREGCDFKIWKTISGKTLTVTDVNDLLESGKTRLLKGFKSKKGSTFEARLVLDSSGNLSFEFDNKKH